MKPLLCKIILLLSSFGYFTLSSLSQPPSVYWQKSFGGTTFDSRAIFRTTSDNGFIIGGFGASINGDFTGTNAGGMDMFMLKLDSCGNKEWSQRFGSLGNDLIYGVAESPDHGFLFAGSTFSNSLPGYHGGIQDAIICKTDADGNIQWTKLLGGTLEDLLDIVIPLADGSYIISGWTNSTDGDAGASNGTTDAWILHIDKDGNVLWKKVFGGPQGDGFFDITPSNDGGFVAAGHTGLTPTTSDLYLVKIDANGNTIWQKSYGGPQTDFGRAVTRAAGGGYIAAGTTLSSGGDVTGLHGKADVWVIRVDENGNLQWQKCIGGSKNESMWQITPLPGNQYLFAASTASNDGDISNNQGDNDALAFTLDGNGNLLWAKTYGGSGSEDFFSVGVTADGSLVLSGYSSSTNGDINGNHGETDFILFKLKDKPISQVDTTSCIPITINNILITHDTSFTAAIKDKCGYDSAIINYHVTITLNNDVQTIDDISIVAGNQVILNTTASGPVQWTGTGLSCYTCLNPVVQPMLDSRYIVSTGTGLCTVSDTVNIYVYPQDTLYVPTAFTPDGNGRNDIFKAIGYAADFNMKIFNRWGEHIFQSKSVLQGWDGTYKGMRQPTGVYVYMIRYKTSTGRFRQLQGTMTLIR